jgi:hypothetical protein
LLAACNSAGSVARQLPTPGDPSPPAASAPSPVSCAHGSPPPTRQNGVLVFDGDRDVMLLFGGAAGQELGDTWTWDCRTWTKVATAAGPPGRELAAAAYDADQHAILLFGGQASPGKALDDTWKWDGSAWKQLHPATSPPARMGAALAFSPTLHRAVLFGGFNGSDHLADTWSWDGSNWTKVNTAAAPAARQTAGFGFDGDHLVLFGGAGKVPAYGDTWNFDGSNWTQASPQSSPPKRSEAHLAEDVVSGSLVLFGGRNVAPPGALGDTWTWHGGVWTESQVAAPPARGGQMLCFYPPARLTLLFGGGSAGGPLTDAWSWNGSTWRAL